MENNKKEQSTKLPLFGILSLWPYLRVYKKRFIRMIILGAITSSIDAIYPLFNKYAINHYIGENTLDTLKIFIALYIMIVLSRGIIDYINIADVSYIEMNMNKNLRNNAFSHLQEVSLSYFNANNVGYIHSRVMSDSGKIGEMCAWKIMDCVWSSAYLICIAIVMLVTNWRLALCVIILVPVVVLLIMIFQKKLLLLNHEVRELNSNITADINEGITGAKSIKVLAISDKMTREFGEDTKRMFDKSMQTARVSSLFTALVTFISSVALALILWRGGRLTIDKLMEIGTLSVFMSYALGMIEPIKNMVNTISSMIGIQANVERYLKLMDTKGEVGDDEAVIEKYGDAFNPKKENWEKLHGDVEFKDVTFHYPDGDEMVLEHFSLKISQGSSVAIVGETGAGKSTLVNLICRFFEPTEGEVLIDGRNAKERSLLWLHSNMGYVLQTPHLFSGTVRDNLKYGNPNATDEEIYEVLSLVSADFVLEKLPKGLDTEAGEGGDFLSTGEKQLLSIARALLANPAILILDEATSSIDTITESAVQKAIDVVTHDRTSFIIAHRLSTITGADMILHIVDGKIAEIGNHEKLMSDKGAYYELFMRQFETENT